jgi:predicted dehydrogenase
MKDGTAMEKRLKITRRQFVGTAAASVSATALLSRGVSGAVFAGPEKGPKLHVACIGLGRRMEPLLREFISLGQRVIALCDPDAGRIPLAKSWLGSEGEKAKGYKDYRKLLEEEKSLNAVIIATPDHWHAPIIKAALRAGKHIYCEKPLTHTLGEAREIRELARKPNVITQTGNQGSASSNLRRNIELIQAGVIGNVTDIHAWHPAHGWPSGEDRPAGEDPVPAGLDWDFWVGPAPMRPYKNAVYHPITWRGWYDFGNGSIGDFCCHAFNLPVRALHLDYPTKIEVSGTGLGKESFAKSCTLRYHFPKRDERGPVTLNFYTGGEMPPAEVTKPLADSFGNVDGTGCLLVGDKGVISAGLWNSDGYLKLNGEAKFQGIFKHEAAKPVPTKFRHVRSHMKEWVDACLGGPKTFSDFDRGGHLTELGLAGALALRIGHDIEWDGEKMEVKGMKEAQAIIHPAYRAGWDV